MPRGASLTAEAVCFFRAIENARPASERLLSDPYAERLLSPVWRPWVASPLVQVGFRGRLLFSPGSLQAFVAARHRWIDDALQAFLAGDGFGFACRCRRRIGFAFRAWREQVVILGAGYDSRALRFKDALAGRPIIEVDFPATQAKKQALLAERVPEMPSAATYLPIDFEKQTLAEGLLSGSFQPGKRTFWVWEGVSMYLHPETVDLTLETVKKLSAPGSEIVCDLWSRPQESTLAARLRRTGADMLRTIGEPIRFALSPSEAPGFFEARGFAVKDACDSKQLAQRYRVQKRYLFPDNSVVRAAVL